MSVSEEIVVAVNHILPKFASKYQFYNFSYFYNLHNQIHDSKNLIPAVLHDRTILCEFNVGLWEKSLITAINTLTKEKCFSHTIVQKFINYLLNGHPYTNFGLLEDFFHTLLLLHPPNLESVNFYKEILCGSYITINGKYIEEKGMFEWLIETFFNCLNESNLSEISVEATNVVNSDASSKIEGNFYDENLNDQLTFSNQKNVMYFEDLLWGGKIKRCLTAMNFTYNILESDFIFLISSERKSHNEFTRPLLSHILWEDKRNIGLCNRIVHRILKIFILGSQLDSQNFQHFSVTKNFMSLLAEIMRLCDKEDKIKHPHLGTKTNDLARELSVQLFELLQNSEKSKFGNVIQLIRSLKPCWFRLLLCSHLLGFITGCHCSPELSTVYDILMKVIIINQTDECEGETQKRSISAVDWKRVRKLRSRTSVNIKYKGKTRLQASCEINDIEEVKALLTFPELDVNGVDVEGWTALHLACAKGSKACVRELLFGLPSQTKKFINTRAKGPENCTPLMCAVLGGHLEICRLLLEHTGGLGTGLSKNCSPGLCIEMITGTALLEDVNDYNKTAIDLSENIEIKRLLNHYKSNCSVMQFDHLKNIVFNEKYKEIILELCSELLQSYFNTYRTWDVCKAMKSPQENSFTIADLKLQIQPEWDYKRYQRDILSNIPKLKELGNQLAALEQFKFTSILSKLCSISF